MNVQDRKTIFALCRELHINDDERHALVFGVTQKESLTELSDNETKAVIHELTERMKMSSRSVPLEKCRPKAYSPQVPGMMTSEQQSLAWRLIYRLKELDDNQSSATAGERMAGVIKKELGITTVPGRNIFRWISFDEGSRLIEKLKMYVRSAERRKNSEQTYR